MSSEVSPELLALSENASLARVSYTELSARTVEDPQDPTDPTFSLQVGSSEEGERFRIKLRVELGVEAGDVAVEAAAEFEVQKPAGEISAPLLRDYANHVGIMVLLPYLRSALSDIAARVFEAQILMPVFQRGELWFGSEDAIS